MIMYQSRRCESVPLVVRMETAEFLELSSEDGTRRFQLTWPEVRMIARANDRHASHTVPVPPIAPLISNALTPPVDALDGSYHWLKQEGLPGDYLWTWVPCVAGDHVWQLFGPSSRSELPIGVVFTPFNIAKAGWRYVASFVS